MVVVNGKERERGNGGGGEWVRKRRDWSAVVN